MKFTNVLTALLLFTAPTTIAAPVNLDARDVWVPKILDPTETTVWKVGGSFFVKWALDMKPQSVTNPNGTIYLSKAGRLDIGV